MSKYDDEFLESLKDLGSPEFWATFEELASSINIKSRALAEKISALPENERLSLGNYLELFLNTLVDFKNVTENINRILGSAPNKTLSSDGLECLENLYEMFTCDFDIRALADFDEQALPKDQLRRAQKEVDSFQDKFLGPYAKIDF